MTIASHVRLGRMDGTEALLRALGKLNAAALAPCAAALVGCLYDGND